MLFRSLNHSQELHELFVLIDSRHDLISSDADFLREVGGSDIPFSIIFTKADKLKKNKLIDNIEAYKTRLLEEWDELPTMFVTSSESGLGKDDVLDFIEEYNKGFRQI